MNSHIPIDDITSNYHQGNPLSVEAFESIKESAGDLRTKVFNFIAEQEGWGATCSEIEVGLNMKHQTASARVTELKAAGKIKPSGVKRLTDSGRNAAVMIVA